MTFPVLKMIRVFLTMPVSFLKPPIIFMSLILFSLHFSVSFGPGLPNYNLFSSLLVFCFYFFFLPCSMLPFFFFFLLFSLSCLDTHPFFISPEDINFKSLPLSLYLLKDSWLVAEATTWMLILWQLPSKGQNQKKIVISLEIKIRLSRKL